MTDKSLELQNLLIEKLTNEKPVTPSTEPSSWGTIGIIVLITVLIVAAGIIIYYVLQNTVKPYPLSPFKYNDTVIIRPAVLSDIKGDIEKQYLTVDTSPCYRNDVFNSNPGYSMGEGACAPKFKGDKNDAKSQWVLMQYSNPSGYDANQSLSAGLGNRFYLQNKSDTTLKASTSRLRYQILNQSGFGMCNGSAPAVIGAGGCDRTPSDCNNWFKADLLIYFMPTNYKDIYYLLFPSCSQVLKDDTTDQPNDGIVAIRPWAQNNASNKNTRVTCTPCNNSGNFNPYVDGQLSDNTMLMNYISDQLPPYSDPNIHLFKVIKIS